jgi:hypothetical protein
MALVPPWRDAVAKNMRWSFHWIHREMEKYLVAP